MSIRWLLQAMLAAALAAPAIAQQKFPVRSVRVLIPFAAGSAVDVLARLYAQHVPMELLQSMTRTRLVHVAYKGVTPAFNDVVAGQVPRERGLTGNAQRLAPFWTRWSRPVLIPQNRLAQRSFPDGDHRFAGPRL